MTDYSSGILFGGDYNPEQWEESTWQDDFIKLSQAQVNSATINVFSWPLLEPAEGEYDFEQLDRIMVHLEHNQICVVLATATAAVPPWLAHKYPEVMRTDINGILQRHGKRHNACPNSPIFKRKSKALVERLVARYHTNSLITHWHVSNEYGGTCYCENCAKAFRVWLKERYGTLEAVNQAWNSHFWGHTYGSWEEINPPMRTSDIFSSGKPVLGGAALDYRRFQSDSLLENYKMERDIIRKYDSKRPITTNFMGSQKDLDYFKWAPELDVIAWDNYPSLDTPASFTAFSHDLMRGLKHQPFMLMEQTPNQQNWQTYNALKKPGEMRMLSYQALAHGANTVQFFQLKQSRNGAEKFHGALLSHSVSTQTRVFQEVAQLGGELAQLPQALIESEIHPNVALIFDWESYWGLENCIGPTTQLDYVASVYRYYQALYQQGIAVEIVSKQDDFSPYKLLLAPSMYITTDEVTEKIKAYTAAGGVFLTNVMSGLVDETDNIHLGGYPGQWRELLGLTIDEIDARPAAQAVTLHSATGIVGQGRTLCDLITPTTAHSLAWYGDETFYQGQACLTANEYGTGCAFYVGTYLDDQGLAFLMTQVLKRAQLAAKAAGEVEIMTRTTENQSFTFIINTGEHPQKIMNPYPDAYELLTQTNSPTDLELAPFAVIILQQDHE